MKTVYRVTCLDMETTETTYEGGDVGKSVIVLNASSGKGYDSLAALFENVCKQYNFPADKESWCMIEDGRLDCQFLVDVNNWSVSDTSDAKLWEDWKKGKAKLWSAYVTVYVVKSQEEDLKDSEVLEFGIALS